MQKYPLTFETPETFNKFLIRLQLVTRRVRQSRADPFPNRNKPLDARESKALQIVSKRVERQIAAIPADARPAAEKTIKEAFEAMGERAYLDFFLIPPQIWGVTYQWFAFNALIMILLFLNTSNFLALFFGGPILHATAYLMCRPKLKLQRASSLGQLLGEALPEG